MKAPILCVRISRRAVAAVVLSDEQLSFFDGRHLRSKRDAALTGVGRYAQVLLDQTRPGSVVLDCPMKGGTSTAELVTVVKAVFDRSGLRCQEMRSADLLHAFGWTQALTRIQMRAVAEPMFPEIAVIHGRVKPYILDAAAGALFVESNAALGASAA